MCHGCVLFIDKARAYSKNLVLPNGDFQRTGGKVTRWLQSRRVSVPQGRGGQFLGQADADLVKKSTFAGDGQTGGI